MRITHYFEKELVSTERLQPDDEEILDDLEGKFLADCQRHELKGVRTIAILECSNDTMETLIEFDKNEVVFVIDWRQDGEYTGLTNDEYTILSVEDGKTIQYVIILNEPYVINKEGEDGAFMKMVLEKHDYVIGHN